jgi:TRAP-type C4-dicarboxylate transport system permease small subunit
MAVVYAALPVSAALMFILTLLNMALAIRTRNSSSGVSQ